MAELTREYGAALFALAIIVLAFDWEVIVNTIELFALVSLIPILLHNGQRGAKMNKWVFYAFYPGHLLLLWLIGRFLLHVIGKRRRTRRQRGGR